MTNTAQVHLVATSTMILHAAPLQLTRPTVPPPQRRCRTSSSVTTEPLPLLTGQKVSHTTVSHVHSHTSHNTYLLPLLPVNTRLVCLTICPLPQVKLP